MPTYPSVSYSCEEKTVKYRLISRYMLTSFDEASRRQFEKEGEQYMAAGWICQGGVSVTMDKKETGLILTQAMINKSE